MFLVRLETVDGTEDFTDGLSLSSPMSCCVSPSPFIPFYAAWSSCVIQCTDRVLMSAAENLYILLFSCLLPQSILDRRDGTVKAHTSCGCCCRRWGANNCGIISKNIVCFSLQCRSIVLGSSGFLKNSKITGKNTWFSLKISIFGHYSSIISFG